MPYDIRKRGDKFCVVKKDGGKSFGCHDTRADAEKQLRAILANSHPKGASMIKLLAATGYKSREADYEGRQYLVVPVVALTEGAVWPMAAKGYEFVAASELRAGGWNGRPVYLGHPVQNGQPISGNEQKLLTEKRLGWVFGAAVKGKKLTMEAWIDKVLCEERAPELFERLQAGDPIEVSVGAFVDLIEDKGIWNQRKYEVAWSRIVPDHLALLPDGDLGACSLEMGCGVRAAQNMRTAFDPNQPRDDHGRWGDGDGGGGGSDSGGSGGSMPKASDLGHTSRISSVVPGANTDLLEPGADAAISIRSSTNTGYGGTSAEYFKFQRKDGAWYQKGEKVTDKALHKELDKRVDEQERAIQRDRERTRGRGRRASDGTLRVARNSDFFSMLMSAFRAAQPAGEMSNNDLVNKLMDKLKPLEPQLVFVQAYFPVTDPDRVIYQCYRMTESVSAGHPIPDYSQYDLWQRAFTLNKDGTIEFDTNRVLVEPVVYYEPVVEGYEPVTAAAGARHSSGDRKAIQAMHDQSVYLGASCSPKAAATGAPCSCQTHAQEEQSMTKEALAKFLETATKDQIDALTAVAEGKPTPAEVKAAAEAKAAADAREASDKAAADAKVAAEKSAADLKAAQEKKPPTFDELLAAADADTRDTIEQGRAASKAKKEQTIKALKDTGRCPYSDEQLAKLSQGELDNLATLAAVPSQKPVVDYSAQAPRGANSSAPRSAPTPPSQIDAIRAMRQPTAAAK